MKRMKKDHEDIENWLQRENAATKIAAVHRGKQQRRKFQNQKMVEIKINLQVAKDHSVLDRELSRHECMTTKRLRINRVMLYIKISYPQV